MIEDLQKVTPADCQRFYDTYYQPNNATVVVVGDVDEAAVRHALDTYFGPIPRAAAPPRAYPSEPTQLHTRDATLSLDANLPVFVAGYHIPAAASADAPALEVLAAILSSGQSSRLNQRLVRRDKVAVLAGGMADLMEDPGMFVVYAAHLPDKDVTRVRQALFDEVARVGRQQVSNEELARARNQLAASFLFGLESVDGVARELGLAEYVQGDWRAFSQRSARYASVTAAEVMRVAAKYLIDSNRTDVTLKSAATKVAADEPSVVGGRP